MDCCVQMQKYKKYYGDDAMRKTTEKLFVALMCASLVMSSLATVVARYDYDGGTVYFSAAFQRVCSIRDYRKQSLEPLPGYDDARICTADFAAASTRDTDGALPGAAYDVCADFHAGSDRPFASGAHTGTRQKSFHMRI